MNKSLIILMAVGLLSVHAFVKREATEAPKTENILETAQQKLKELSDQFKENVNPESVKAALDKLHEQTKNLIDEMTKKKA